jgi:IS30 family transposase
MGAGNRSAIGTLVERSTRFVILLHIPDQVGSAETVAHALSVALSLLPAGLRRTLTWDQGKELAQHQETTAQTATSVFFCEPHSPWQRGSNENMNGLLRDYFPKGTGLTAVTAADLERVALEIDQRPRKTLDWNRPADLFATALTGATSPVA